MQWKSKSWYLAIALVLIAGYIIGGYYWYGVQFLGLLPGIKSVEGRNILIVIFGGILGATMYCSWFFAKDANEKLGKDGKPEDYPTCVDPFGYLILILGGGLTAVILVAALKAGILVVSSDDKGDLTREAIWVFSLGGGLATQSVKAFLIQLVNKTIKKQPKPGKGKK